MAFHGWCIVLDTHALFLYVHQFSFTCHCAGSMEKGRERGGWRGEEGQTQAHSSRRACKAGAGNCISLRVSLSKEKHSAEGKWG